MAKCIHQLGLQGNAIHNAYPFTGKMLAKCIGLGYHIMQNLTTFGSNNWVIGTYYCDVTYKQPFQAIIAIFVLRASSWHEFLNMTPKSTNLISLDFSALFQLK